ncbi:S8 family peptidase [Paraflavitalea pollutisoli]|uniref:S8 family peptidase n=1 Tax=Paraflavitalea pollutisoli TaxID=3034143 RepID=UPI0023ECB454|nr:S8/S53 family peptidase [Paraflavitalea sp. H1-2-19X]
MKAILKYPLYRRISPSNEEEAKGYLPVGSVINITKIESGVSIDTFSHWYLADDGFYYWGGGVDALESSLPLAGTNAFAGDFWFKDLGIRNIWSQHSEMGERAQVLILDSGVNKNITQIAAAIKEPVLNFVPDSTSTTSNDPFSHGTHCASLIAARDPEQFVGAAPACQLLVGKITESGKVKDAGTMKAALREYLKDQYDIDIISISQQLFKNDDELKVLVEDHVKKGRIVVASMGNDPLSKNQNFDRYPGRYEVCIGVGSCSADKKLSSFSIFPSKTSIFCFGEQILSYQKNDTPTPLKGTSQATAIVAGICALVISWLKKNGFTYTPAAIRDLLQKYSTPLNGSQGPVIHPILIFNTLDKFKKHEKRNLQDCIDADLVSGH